MNNLRFERSVEIAKEIIESGGEVHRAEEAVERINGDRCSIFALPSLIIAQIGDLIQIKRIKHEDIDLARLARLNEESRRLCCEYTADSSYKAEYSNITEAISYLGATGCYCLYFGGNIIEGIFAGLIGALLSQLRFCRLSLPSFSINLIEAFIAGILAFFPRVIGLNTNESKIIIGAIMLLVPGLTVVNASRDIMSSDILAGTIEFINAIISALAIALGISGALVIMYNL